MQSTTPTLISLIPDLHGGAGHVLGYHMSVSRAAQLCGWKHVVLFTPDARLPELPPGWRPVLRNGSLSVGLPQALRAGRITRLVADVRVFSRSIAAALEAEIRSAPGPCVLFMEDFNGPQLLAVRLALARLRCQDLRFWLLYRHDPLASGLAGRLYRRVTLSIARLFAAGRFRLLADSEPLASAVEAMLGMPAHVMPIPHTDVRVTAAPFSRGDEIVCWWPGAPRPEKGLATIEALAASHNDNDAGTTIRLVVSRAANLQRTGRGIIVHPVQPTLSAQEYQDWFGLADVILLPYEPTRYRTSTSGIFAECVAAGKVPVVGAGTWMAHELLRHGLPELVVDWRDPEGFLRAIHRARAAPEILQRLACQRTSFIAFHNEASYAREMNKLLAPTLPTTRQADLASTRQADSL